jgi:hypothetical protein
MEYVFNGVYCSNNSWLGKKKWQHLLKMEGVKKDVENYFEVFQRHIVII